MGINLSNTYFQLLLRINFDELNNKIYSQNIFGRSAVPPSRPEFKSTHTSGWWHCNNISKFPTDEAIVEFCRFQCTSTKHDNIHDTSRCNMWDILRRSAASN